MFHVPWGLISIIFCQFTLRKLSNKVSPSFRCQRSDKVPLTLFYPWINRNCNSECWRLDFKLDWQTWLCRRRLEILCLTRRRCADQLIVALWRPRCLFSHAKAWFWPDIPSLHSYFVRYFCLVIRTRGDPESSFPQINISWREMWPKLSKFD